MRLISRAEWGATAKQGPPMTLPSRGVWLHHTVTAPTDDPASDQRNVERVGVERFKRFSYSWTYHLHSRAFLEGAGNTVGAHTAGQNSTTHGLSLIGNFDGIALPDFAVADIAEFIRHGGEQGWWKPVLLGGHRDLKATACPGGNAYRRIGDIRAALGQPAPSPVEDDMPKLIRIKGKAEVYHLVGGRLLVHIPSSDMADLLCSTTGRGWESKVEDLPADHPVWKDAMIVGAPAGRLP